jgi:NCAIR mutase (PurE)-related protein
VVARTAGTAAADALVADALVADALVADALVVGAFVVATFVAGVVAAAGTLGMTALGTSAPPVPESAAFTVDVSGMGASTVVVAGVALLTLEHRLACIFYTP